METLIKRLNDAGVRYVVIGGQAMLQEGMPRFTLDWDLFIPPDDPNNIAEINAALADEIDIEIEPYDIKTGTGFIQTFQTSGGVIQFHFAPPGLSSFTDVERNAVTHKYAGIPIKYLCLGDLLKSKLASARDKDSDDILFLKTKQQAKSNCSN